MAVELYCNTKLCIVTKVARRLGNCITVQCAWAARRAALHAQKRAHTPTTRRWRAQHSATIRPLGLRHARGKARRGAGNGARHSAQGRPTLCLRYGAGAPRHRSLRLQYDRAARPRYGAGLATTRTSARLVHWLGQLGAHAASLVFDLGF